MAKIENSVIETEQAGGVERALRRRVIKGVKIRFGDHLMSAEGVMKNISQTGALIELSPGIIVPDEFTIICELDGYKQDCSVVRRKANRLAIQFVSAKQELEFKRPHVVGMIEPEKCEQAGQDTWVGDGGREIHGRPEATNRSRRRVVFGQRGK